MPESPTQLQNIIIYSTADWDNPFWTNKQHVADQLAARGHRVLYVESLGLRAPTLRVADGKRILGRLKKFTEGLHTINENLFVLSPLAIPGGGKFAAIKKLNDQLVKLQMQRAVTTLGMESHWAWTYNPMSLELLSKFNPQKIIYHTVDDLSAAPGMDTHTIKKQEALLLKRADIIFCTSTRLLENAKRQTTQPVFYFPNVVDMEHFSRNHGSSVPEDLASIRGPRLGFVGAISSYKLDMALINQTAERHPEWSFVFIGKVGEGEPNSELTLKALNNIHILGPRSYNDVARYMHHFDVGLIPTPINEYTQSMFPMKFFEYLASDTPVVARNIDALKDFSSLHFPYATPEEFESQVKKALNSASVYEIHGETLKKFTWKERLDSMLSQIQSV